ncbi:ABC transporter permease [Micromonospora sp. WMMD1082]|uniref:ABC transporter permease n=1 Tax=Micromonospora sp. WMMD1082 TaxID=3016104 RepID=UPI002415F9CF|nr:ABC transporter permease [Micromonospora sp. WMMD1082]MDG4798369.1 ABC transporter permease [Micromonospora sp. WMMD1082]
MATLDAPRPGPVAAAADLSAAVRVPPWRRLAGQKLAAAAALFLLLLSIGAVFGPLVSPHDPHLIDLSMRNLPPGTAAADGGLPHLLGTDALGRDVLSRIILGARVTLAVGLASVLLSGVVGVAVGLVAGHYRGRTDEVVMRFVDLQMSIPSLLIALLVLYVLGGSFLNVILVLAVIRWMVYTRLTRGLMLTLREQLYVEAAHAIGARDLRVIFRHMLPNLLSPILVLATLEVATVLLTESSLSFLGLGIQPPDTSWGQMLSEGREYLRNAWWLIMFPGLAILFTALSLNILANWMRERSGPQK